MYQTLLLNDLSQAAAECRGLSLMFFLVTNAKTNAPKYSFSPFHAFHHVFGVKTQAVGCPTAFFQPRFGPNLFKIQKMIPLSRQDWPFYSSLTRKSNQETVFLSEDLFPPRLNSRRLLLARQRLRERASCSSKKPHLAARGTRQDLYGEINSRMKSDGKIIHRSNWRLKENSVSQFQKN